MSPLLNFVSDDEDNHVPPELKQFSFSLKMARKIGEAGRNTDICQGNVTILYKNYVFTKSQNLLETHTFLLKNQKLFFLKFQKPSSAHLLVKKC